MVMQLFCSFPCIAQYYGYCLSLAIFQIKFAVNHMYDRQKPISLKLGVDISNKLTQRRDKNY